LLLNAAVVNALLEDRRRLEHHHTPRRDWYFFTGLWVTTDSLALLSYYKRSKRRKFDRFSALKTVGDLLEHQFYQCRRFRPRQTDFLIHRLTQVGPRNSFSAHRLPCPRRRYPAELSTILAWPKGVNGATPDCEKIPPSHCARATRRLEAPTTAP